MKNLRYIAALAAFICGVQVQAVISPESKIKLVISKNYDRLAGLIIELKKAGKISPTQANIFLSSEHDDGGLLKQLYNVCEQEKHLLFQSSCPLSWIVENKEAVDKLIEAMSTVLDASKKGVFSRDVTPFQSPRKDKNPDKDIEMNEDWQFDDVIQYGFISPRKDSSPLGQGHNLCKIEGISEAKPVHILFKKETSPKRPQNPQQTEIKDSKAQKKLVFDEESPSKDNKIIIIPNPNAYVLPKGKTQAGELDMWFDQVDLQKLDDILNKLSGAEVLKERCLLIQKKYLRAFLEYIREDRELANDMEILHSALCQKVTISIEKAQELSDKLYDKIMLFCSTCEEFKDLESADPSCLSIDDNADEDILTDEDSEVDIDLSNFTVQQGTQETKPTKEPLVKRRK